MSIKDLLGILSILIAAVAYTMYFRQIFKAGVRPHPFSWLPWGLINLLAYLAQHTQHGGPGSWVTLMTACVCFVITLVTVLKFGLQASRVDWLCLGAAVLVFAIYLQTKEPAVAAILASVTNTALFGPTLMKSWRHPHTDSAGSFALNGVKFLVSIPALGSWNIATLLYPCVVTVLNFSVTAVLLFRRRR